MDIQTGLSPEEDDLTWWHDAYHTTQIETTEADINEYDKALWEEMLKQATTCSNDTRISWVNDDIGIGGGGKLIITAL
jgi:hypothetical protein